MKRVVRYLTSRCKMLQCISTVMWHSFAIILGAKKHSSPRNFINTRLRIGACALLKDAKASYSIRFTHPEEIKPNTGYIFMSNHQSLFDLPLIFALMPPSIRVIAKKELFEIPIFGKALSLSECIPVDRLNPAKNPHFALAVKNKLQEGISIWIFPEGTRSKSGDLLPLKPGGFRLALESNASIVPVALRGTNRILPSGSSHICTGHSPEIIVGKPLAVSTYQGFSATKDLMDTIYTQIAELLS